MNVAVSGFTLSRPRRRQLLRRRSPSACVPTSRRRRCATWPRRSPSSSGWRCRRSPARSTVSSAAQTLQTATTGTLGFTTPAPSTSVPGRYAILGGGLSAANYTFVQDAANDTALTLTHRASAEVIVTSKIVDAAPTAGAAADGASAAARRSGTGRRRRSGARSASTASRQTTGAGHPDHGAAPASFEPVSLSDLSNEALVDMLDAPRAVQAGRSSPMPSRAREGPGAGRHAAVQEP